jgi:DNA modification methylase
MNNPPPGSIVPVGEASSKEAAKQTAAFSSAPGVRAKKISARKSAKAVLALNSAVLPVAQEDAALYLARDGATTPALAREDEKPELIAVAGAVVRGDKPKDFNATDERVPTSSGTIDDGIDPADESRQADVSVNRKIDLLRELLKREEQTLWEQGDVLVSIGKSVNLKTLSNQLNRSMATLSERRKVAKAFAPELRDLSRPFSDYVNALRAAETFHLAVTDVLAETAAPAAEPLNEIQKPNAKRLTQPRDVMAYFDAKRSTAALKQALEDDERRTVPADDEITNRCHNSRWQDIVARIDDGAAQVVNIDPPYSNYLKHGDGHLDMSVGACRSDCDNNTSEDAIRETVDALPEAKRIRSPQGIVLLWQSSRMIAQPIDAFIRELFDVETVAVWPKPRPKLEDPAGNYGAQYEACFVLKHKGAKLVNFDPQAPRGHIWTADPIQPKAERFSAHHQMEKPVVLLEHPIRKHSLPGDLVVELFGCSGSGCRAAINLDRRWVYCESNANNFRFGQHKIADALRLKESAIHAGHGAEHGVTKENTKMLNAGRDASQRNA